MADFSELFRSTEEQITPVDSTVHGVIPSWLNGTLLRLGPGKFDLGDDFIMNHWFDGFGVIIKFKIKNGKVTLMKKFVQSDAYKRAVAVGKPVFIEYGTRSFTDPNKTLFSRLRTALLPELTDSCGVNIFKIEESIYAATETNFIRRINPANLDTCEKVNLSNYVKISWACSHVLKDDAGISWTVGTSASTSGFQYHIVKIPPSSKKNADDALQNATVITSIPSAWKTNVSYYHSFVMSDNYIIFIEQPFIISGMKVMAIQVKCKSLRECMDWYPEEMTRFIVVEKTTGRIISNRIKTNAFFSLHHINAFEKDGHIIVDTVGHASPEIVDKLFLDKLRNSQYSDKDPSCARRYVIPNYDNTDSLCSGVNLIKINSLATATKVEDDIILTPESLTDDHGYELPSINPLYLGKSYRYFYACALYDPGKFRNSLLKVDTVTKSVQTWKENEFTYPGEIYFVPNPNGKEEDDGILLSAVTDVRKEKEDFLLLLDAKTFTEIARANFNVHIPNLLHSLFISDETG